MLTLHTARIWLAAWVSFANCASDVYSISVPPETPAPDTCRVRAHARMHAHTRTQIRNRQWYTSLQVYYLVGMTDVASAYLTTVLLSMLIQMVGVTYNHRQRGFGPLVLELLIVLSCFKPLVDTRRVLNAHKIVGAPVDANGRAARWWSWS